jgi:hypothetical protein
MHINTYIYKFFFIHIRQEQVSQELHVQKQHRQELYVPPQNVTELEGQRAHYNVEDMAIRVVVRKRPISRLELARYVWRPYTTIIRFIEWM